VASSCTSTESRWAGGDAHRPQPLLDRRAYRCASIRGLHTFKGQAPAIRWPGPRRPLTRLRGAKGTQPSGARIGEGQVLKIQIELGNSFQPTAHLPDRRWPESGLPGTGNEVDASSKGTPKLSPPGTGRMRAGPAMNTAVRFKEVAVIRSGSNWLTSGQVWVETGDGQPGILDPHGGCPSTSASEGPLIPRPGNRLVKARCQRGLRSAPSATDASGGAIRLPVTGAVAGGRRVHSTSRLGNHTAPAVKGIGVADKLRAAARKTFSRCTEAGKLRAIAPSRVAKTPSRALRNAGGTWPGRRRVEHSPQAGPAGWNRRTSTTRS